MQTISKLVDKSELLVYCAIFDACLWKDVTWKIWSNYCNPGNFRERLIFVLPVCKFLEVMKINSLLINFPGLKCSVKRAQLLKLVAYDMPNCKFTKFISFLKFPGLQYFRFWELSKLLQTGDALSEPLDKAGHCRPIVDIKPIPPPFMNALDDKQIPLDKPQKMTNNHPMRQSFFCFLVKILVRRPPDLLDLFWRHCVSVFPGFNNGMTCPVLNSVGKSPDLNDSLNTVAIFPAIHFADSLSSAELMLLGPDAFDGLKEKFGLFVDFEFLTEMGSWGTD